MSMFKKIASICLCSLFFMCLLCTNDTVVNRIYGEGEGITVSCTVNGQASEACQVALKSVNNDIAKIKSAPPTDTSYLVYVKNSNGDNIKFFIDLDTNEISVSLLKDGAPLFEDNKIIVDFTNKPNAVEINEPDSSSVTVLTDTVVKIEAAIIPYALQQTFTWSASGATGDCLYKDANCTQAVTAEYTGDTVYFKTDSVGSVTVTATCSYDDTKSDSVTIVTENVIRKVELTADLPAGGVVVTCENDAWVNQSPLPNASVSESSPYTITQASTSGGLINLVYWAKNQGNNPEPFSGVFVPGKEYVLFASVIRKGDYTFAQDVVVTLNGQAVKGFVISNDETVVNLWATLTATTPEDYYFCKAGDGGVWQKGSSSTLDFTFDRSVDGSINGQFKIDGDSEYLDEKNYKEETGSLIIKLKPEYLETLSVGSHTINAYFADYTLNPVTANFTISEEKKEDKSSKKSTKYYIPKTGIE